MPGYVGDPFEGITRTGGKATGGTIRVTVWHMWKSAEDGVGLVDVHSMFAVQTAGPNENIFLPSTFHQLRANLPGGGVFPATEVFRPCSRGPKHSNERSQTPPFPRRLLYDLALLETEAPVAYAFWIKRHDVRVDAETHGITTRKFRSSVLEEGPLADIFADTVVSEPNIIENRRIPSFAKSGTERPLRSPIPRGLYLILLRAESPAAYSFWTEHFGAAMKVSKTLFRAALAHSGRRYDALLTKGPMTTRIFRTLVVGPGPLADMFPSSGPIEAHRFAHLDPPKIGNAVDPSSGFVRVGSNLVSRSPYSALDPNVRIETLRLLRIEHPIAYQFWTVNFGARETPVANFRATLRHFEGTLDVGVTLPGKVSPVWFREMMDKNGSLAKMFSFVGASMGPRVEDPSNEGLAPE
ncbi:hypothetical protein BDK51DRAFT_28289, partial [Blyttiomyces helicus]